MYTLFWRHTCTGLELIFCIIINVFSALQAHHCFRAVCELIAWPVIPGHPNPCQLASFCFMLAACRTSWIVLRSQIKTFNWGHKPAFNVFFFLLTLDYFRAKLFQWSLCLELWYFYTGPFNFLVSLLVIRSLGLLYFGL